MGKLLIIPNADFSEIAIGKVTPVADTPVISISEEGNVSIVNDGSGSIYYTTNGSTPTKSSTLYTSTFTVTVGTVVKAVSISATGKSSSVSVKECASIVLAWNPTKVGGYYGANGNLINNPDYDSMMVDLTPSLKYSLIQQTMGNNVRVYSVSGDSYTQVTSSNQKEFEYTCPNDGVQYAIQVVYSYPLAEEHPDLPSLSVSKA